MQTHSENRPFWLGQHKTEQLERVSENFGDLHNNKLEQPDDSTQQKSILLSESIQEYQRLFSNFLSAPIVHEKAEIPDDPLVRALNLKSTAFF